MDRLLKHIHRVLPAMFCCRDFFLLHDNVPTHKAASFCQFLTPKKLQPFITPWCSPDLFLPDYFLFPKLKMKLKGLHFLDVDEIQEAVTDELKRSKKRNFWKLFWNWTTEQKTVYMPLELTLKKKRYVSSSVVSRRLWPAKCFDLPRVFCQVGGCAGSLTL